MCNEKCSECGGTPVINGLCADCASANWANIIEAEETLGKSCCGVSPKSKSGK